MFLQNPPKTKISKNENPSQPIELQRHATFDFKEEIQMSVVGKVGDNLEMKVNYKIIDKVNYCIHIILTFSDHEQPEDASLNAATFKVSRP